MDSISNIADGWLRFILTRFFNKDIPECEREEISKRIDLCMNCEFFEKRNTRSKLLRYRCSICKCIFPGMAFSYKKSCPIKKWDSIPK